MSENNEREFYTLTDEDGNEIEFELIGVAEKNGITYYAMIPVEAAEDSDNEEGFCWKEEDSGRQDIHTKQEDIRKEKGGTPHKRFNQRTGARESRCAEKTQSTAGTAAQE